MIELDGKKLTAKATVKYVGEYNGSFHTYETLKDAQKVCPSGTIHPVDDQFWLEDEEGKKQGPAQQFAHDYVKKEEVGPNHEVIAELKDGKNVLVQYVHEESTYVDNVVHLYKCFDAFGNCLTAGRFDENGKHDGRWAHRSGASFEWEYTDYEHGDEVRGNDEIRQDSAARRSAFKNEQKLKGRLLKGSQTPVTKEQKTA